MFMVGTPIEKTGFPGSFLVVGKYFPVNGVLTDPYQAPQLVTRLPGLGL